MNKLTRGALLVFGLVCLWPSITLSYVYPPPYPPPGEYHYRPQTPGNSRGYAPGYTANPYAYTQQRPAQFPSRLELELSDTQPYVQENILLTLRVISASNLKTVDPILPQNQSASFHRIKEPTAYSRMAAGGQQQIINELVYMLTPLRDGRIELPISVRIENAGDGYATTAMTLAAETPIHMEVRAADTRVSPWLALQQLALTTNIDAPMQVEPGKPVALVLKLSAAGATGSQLPSLERLLDSPDFRVYREKSETAGGLSQNGRHIMGTRTEHYTLVPQYGGKLRLPSARISWFNVNTGTPEHTSLPIKTLDASGRAAGLERFFGGVESGSLFPAGYASAFWLPLSGIFLLLTGYWFGVWFKGRQDKGPPSPNAPAKLAPIGQAARAAATGARRAIAKLNPAPYWQRAILRAAAWLPTPLRFWFWVRCANDEKDPVLWCKTLQFMSCRQLALSPYAPLPEMAEKIIQCQPKSDPTTIRDLFKTLDGAMYGQQTIDFEQWKKAFKKQVRPGIRRRVPQHTKAEHRLPELNPKAA